MEENKNVESSSSVDAKMPEVDDSVTMVDVLKAEEDLEADSTAVLGGSDEKACTYYLGYIKRQALYSCLTCVPESRTDVTKAAGVCLACSYHCHEHHELIELYTKRNFRCDCGLKGKMPNKCGLDAIKLDENTQNKYNQNFSSFYCNCHRPYPDPEDTVVDEMIQCVGCEDWYHARHLNVKMPSSNAYSEMICGGCMEKNEFLRSYAGLSIFAVPDDSINNSTLNVTSIDDSIISNAPQTDEEEVVNGDGKRSLDASGSSKEPAAKKAKADGSDPEVSIECIKPPTSISSSEDGATFWPEGWRKSLCKCSACIQLYKDHAVEFLIDLEDTVHFYEEKGKLKNRETDFVRGMRALNSMGHVQKVDALTEYNRMTEKLKEYLNSFVLNRQIVTEDDINRFFKGMKDERASQAAAVAPQNFCR